MSAHKNISAETALKKLMEGNREYLEAKTNHQGDISSEIREHTHHHGQNPFAIIITCSDSRVIPEHIFMKGIGELFVIRIAGNVLDDFGLGSVEYGIEHLGCRLIMVLGHTQCGAIQASLGEKNYSYIGRITDSIKEAIGNTDNAVEATKINAIHTKEVIEKNIHLPEGTQVISAVYHTLNGKVEIVG